MNNMKKIEDAFQKISEKLLRSRNVAIVTHISPDGDAIGSVLGLKEILEKYNTNLKVDAFVVGSIPRMYKFLPDEKTLISIDKNYDLTGYRPDMAIVLDCGAKDRLAAAENIFGRAEITINIDHHGSNPGYGDINIIDPEAAATGEIIYQFMQFINILPDANIATNLYTAILTDTGGFKYGNTTGKAMGICATLIEAGANPQYIYQQCYENKPPELFQLHAQCLNLTKLSPDGKIAWTIASRDLIERLNARDEYLEGLVEVLRQINTVDIAMLFKETKDGNIKVSFRSKKIEITPLAEFFDGGGHKFAAGCTMKGYNLAIAVETMVKKAEILVKDFYC